MYELKVRHTFHSGDIVYFLKNNEIRKGVVCKVIFKIETKGFTDGYYVESLFKKLLKSFDKEREYNINLSYQIDLLMKDIDKYHSTPHYFKECELFASKKELLESL